MTFATITLYFVVERSKCRGFAALSLVISLLAIALIAFLAITYMTGQRGERSIPAGSPIQRAKSVECLAQIRKIELQIQLSSMLGGRYPESLNALEGLSESEVRCPVTQDYYVYDPSSGRISCLAHTR